ncbi:28S ribosomal protein S9, mitochondrial [Copidosoma floridanum]|uniref:28S ribosomal protein S9, mitochondrial n=1 Tax=Copidosoma floridanum TaxID=29053 RepID=UPI0006C981D4|nr:28S ribosomal protein S9, mitochondrial [Copidosoma floridanum]
MAVSNAMFSQIAVLKNVVTSGNVASKLFMRISDITKNICLYSTTNTSTSVDNVSITAPQKKMSKAMLAYLERAKAYDTFIKKETEDYQIGKRHLANMMGEDPDNFTDQDVQSAIQYLFPSGIHDKMARPVMKPPEEIFPRRKAAEFDETGRPYHSMFYTTRPNFFKDIVEELENLDNFEDSMIRKGVAPKPENMMDLSTSDWLTHQELEKVLLEKLYDYDYEYFIASIQRLADHPYSEKAKGTLSRFRQERRVVAESLSVAEFEYDADGRPFIVVKDCMRKSARAEVTVKGAGSGIITINGRTLIQYFADDQEREQVTTTYLYQN